MKVRNGFVSNSSSSSYVIRIPRQLLDLKDYGDWFQIEGKSAEEAQEIAVCLWYVLDTHRRFNKDDYFPTRDNVLEDPRELLEYYRRSVDQDKADQMLKELEHPDHYPDTEIIAFRADDNEGNLIDYKMSELLSNAGDGVIGGSNVYAINEH